MWSTDITGLYKKYKNEFIKTFHRGKSWQIRLQRENQHQSTSRKNRILQNVSKCTQFCWISRSLPGLSIIMMIFVFKFFTMKSFYLKLISVLQSESETGLQKSQKINEKSWNEGKIESKGLRLLFRILAFLRNGCFFSIRSKNSYLLNICCYELEFLNKMNKSCLNIFINFEWIKNLKISKIRKIQNLGLKVRLVPYCHWIRNPKRIICGRHDLKQRGQIIINPFHDTDFVDHWQWFIAYGVHNIDYINEGFLQEIFLRWLKSIRRRSFPRDFTE